jgi:hypothetical protein
MTTLVERQPKISTRILATGRRVMSFGSLASFFALAFGLGMERRRALDPVHRPD